jgi:GntR family transcriptional regulator, rspAB operon transcriptional repressor
VSAAARWPMPWRGLQTEGLVDVVPQAGTFVARFSMQEIREGAFLREAIELAAIERVAEIITDDQLRFCAET